MANKTHGLSKSSEYQTWLAMKNRCLNPKHLDYKNYGGRGVTVCERWLNSFQHFYADMGPRPSTEHSIDREDNNGNYEPSNCRWATSLQQAGNRRSRALSPESIAQIRAAGRQHKAHRVEPLPMAISTKPLSPREVELIRLALSDLSKQEIAERLGIAHSTATSHIHAIYTKLQVRNRRELRDSVTPQEVSHA